MSTFYRILTRKLKGSEAVDVYIEEYAEVVLRKWSKILSTSILAF